jgi:hypothetical protein
MSDCNILDKLRKPKIFDMSIFDWATSLIAAYYFGIYFCNMKNKSTEDWLFFFTIWTLVGILIHKLFNIDTQLGYYLGLNKKPIRKEC